MTHASRGAVPASGSFHLSFTLALVIVLAWSIPASAQLSRVGNSIGLIDVSTWGTDACYDPGHQLYLVVGGQGTLYGIFVNTSGTPASAPFVLGSTNAGADPTFGLFPHCAYGESVSGGQGGFLVTWYQNGSVMAMSIANPNGASGTSSAPAVLNGLAASGAHGGPGVAYSRTSQKFLVAWPTLGLFDIHARFVDTNGAAAGSVITVLEHTGTVGGFFPAVAWGPDTDEFGVAYAGFDDANRTAFAAMRRVRASDGQMSSATTAGIDAATFATDITYNTSTGRWVVGWAVPPGSKNAEIDQAGSVVRSGLQSSRVGSAQSYNISYNGVSGTFLSVSEDSQSSDVVGIELDATAMPKTATQQVLTNGGVNGSFWPSLTARTDAKEWNITFARNFTATTNQIISTTSSEAGPAAPTSSVQMVIDQPANGAVLAAGASFTVSGWAVDRGVTDGSSGIDAVHVYAVPSGGAPQFLGAASSLTSRNDLFGTFGSQSLTAGFSITAGGLPAGSYAIHVYARSTMTGHFSSRTVSVTVQGATTTQPLMVVDGPANGSTLTGTFTVSGWAVDLAAPSGTGVDAVHVWAFPSGGNPVFLGAASYGVNRTDVGNALGPQFARSGFSVNATLPSGSYRITAYMHDVLTGTFNWAQSVDVTVAVPVSSVLMVVDAPTGPIMVRGSTISGWAVDLGSINGSGIDAVHVYAFDGASYAFLGAATNGGSRADVGTALGYQFSNAGYSLTPEVGLLRPLTNYDIVVFAHSAVTGAWHSQVVRVTTQ